MEIEAMSKKKSLKKTLLSQLTGNWIAIIALILSIISLYPEFFPPPPRAKLTIFIEHYSTSIGSANELNFDIWGKIVNDGPLWASIKQWDLFVGLDMNNTILGRRFNYIPKNLTISQPDKIDFTMGQTLIGENGSRLPETAIETCVVTFWYEDNIGIQEAKKGLSFI